MNACSDGRKDGAFWRWLMPIQYDGIPPARAHRNKFPYSISATWASLCLKRPGLQAAWKDSYSKYNLYAAGSCRLVYLNEAGGILDDLMYTE